MRPEFRARCVPAVARASQAARLTRERNGSCVEHRWATQRRRVRRQCATKECDVENWGQGPWFELDRNDDTGSVDGGSGADVAARETASRPLATPPDAPADVVEPGGGDIADGVGGV